LQVPLLNLSIQWPDRLARSRSLRSIDPAGYGRGLAGRGRYLASTAVWAGVFALMSTLQAVGDDHPGQGVPFWQTACDEDRSSACDYLAGLQRRYCDSGSGWACNEVGRVARDRVVGNDAFRRGCGLGFESACRNLTRLAAGREPFAFAHAPPTLADYPIILRGTKGPIVDRSPVALRARACRQGWADTCER